MNLIPKVLVATPHSKRHQKVLKQWIKHLNSLTYPNFDVCLVDNTTDKGEYYNKIKDLKVKDKQIISWRHEWNPKKLNHLQMLAHVREEIRQYFLSKDYDFLFFCDDDIFIPKNGIQRLVYYNKDHVGFFVHIYYKPKRKPAVFKSGEVFIGKGLDLYTFSEIAQYRAFVRKFKANKLTYEEKNLVPFIIKDLANPELFKTYAIGIGCCMIKRKVLEQCQFRTHLTFIWGEDNWYFGEANDKKFEFWCVSERVEHRNTDWSHTKESTKNSEFVVMFGNPNANTFDIIDYTKRRKNVPR